MPEFDVNFERTVAGCVTISAASEDDAIYQVESMSTKDLAADEITQESTRVSSVVPYE